MMKVPDGEESFAGLSLGSRLAAIVVTSIGCLVMVERLMGIDLLTRPPVEPLSMPANTAIAFVLAGTSLWIAGTGRTGSATRLLARACAALVAVIGLFTLGEYLYGWGFGVDQLLVPEAAHPAAASLRQLAPNTPAALLLVGASLLLLHGETPLGHRLSQALATGAGLFALLATVGHFYGSETVAGIPSRSPMALPTAVTLLVLCLGIPLARPNQGLVAVLTSQAAAGMLARRLLLWVIGVPLVLGWLFLQGQFMGLYDQVDTLSLVTVSCITILMFQVLAISWRLDWLESQRQRAREDAAELRHSLQRRLADQMAKLDRDFAKYAVKQGDELLRESEDSLRFVLEGGELGFWDLNLKTGEVRRNDRWAELFGDALPGHEFSLERMAALYHPDDRAAAWQSVQDHLLGLTPSHEVECRMLARDGQHRWILERARVVRRDPKGRPLRMIGTHRDLTGSKQVEESPEGAHIHTAP